MPNGAELYLRLGAKAAILGPVQLRVGAAERVGISGRSGIGKSTLLRLLAGLDQDFIGTLEHNAARPAMVFQAPNLLAWRNVRDNITLAAPDGLAPLPLLHALDLAGCENHFPRHLSLGMQRRVALARALAARPDLLLLDEPFASLDPHSADLCHGLVAGYNGTLILVSHDEDDIRRHCTRQIILAGQPAAITRDCRV